MIRMLFLSMAVLFTAGQMTAQTKMIAHKSHSGSEAGFRNSGADDFGDPGPYAKLDSVIKINDSTVIMVKTWVWGKTGKERETVVNDPYFINPKIGVDSLRRLFPEVVFVGFDKKNGSGKKTQQVKRHSSFSVGVVAETRRSYWLLLLCCGAGLIAGLFSWRSARTKFKS